MRLIVFIISSIIGGILTAGVAPQAEIFGLQADMLLVLTLCCVMIDESPLPVVPTAVVAVIMDLFYTGTVGVYSVPYVLVCLIVAWVMKGRKKDRILAPVIVCAAAWIVKDVINALSVFLDGNTFDFWKGFFTGTLPETLLNCLLMIGAYQLYWYIFSSKKRTGARQGGVEIPLRERKRTHLRRSR